MLFALLTLFISLLTLAAEGTVGVDERCSACHGVNGVSSDIGTPHLNGQNEDYLHRQIESLHSGRRSQTTHIRQHIPPEASAGEWSTWAKFYAGAYTARPSQETTPDKVGRGEGLYYSRCEACHLDEGRDYAEGKNNYIPRLAGQELAYLLGQMQMFASGKRPFAALQDGRFHNLDIDDFDDLAHYFASRSAASAKVPVRKRKKN